MEWQESEKLPYVATLLLELTLVLSIGCQGQPAGESGEKGAPPNHSEVGQNERETNDKYEVGLFEVIDDDPLKGLRIDALPGEATCLAEDKKGALWLGLRFSGIARYDDGELRLFDAYNAQLPDQGIQDILVTKDNVKWFATVRGYLFSYDERRATQQRWRTSVIDESRDDNRRRLQIQRLREHPDGTIWGVLERGGLIQLQNDQAKVHHVEELRGTEANSIDIDKDGQFWIATRQGVFYGQGMRWEALPNDAYGKEVRRTPIVWDIYCNPHDGAVYFATNNGLVRFHNGASELWTEDSHGFIKNRVTTICGDENGKFVVGYGNTGDGISLFGGMQWLHFAGNLRRGRLWLKDAVVSQTGSVFAVTRRGRLYSIRGDKFSCVVAQMNQRELNAFYNRMPWRNTALKDMVGMKSTDAEIDAVLKQPHKYYNKKIRIVGHIASSFEYAELIAADGTHLRAWPKYHYELFKFLDQSGWHEKLKGLDTKEYHGYLEYGGYYGHLSGWPLQFYVVEVYPHSDEASDEDSSKVSLRRDLSKWLDDRVHDSLITSQPQTEERATVRRQLQGKWDVVSLEERGVVEDNPSEMYLTIEWDRLTWDFGNRRDGFIMRIAPDRPIPSMDLHQIDDPSNFRHGIYELKGDCLRIHLTKRHLRSSRPRSWQTSEDAETTLLTLRRNSSFESLKSRTAIKRDPRDWHETLAKTGMHIQRDAFGRVSSIRFNITQGSTLVSDEDLLALVPLKNLEYLRLSSKEVTDEGLRTISNIGTLRFLSLGRCTISDTSLAQLRKLAQLRTLSVSSPSITGSCLDELAGMPNLTELQLWGTHVTNGNLAHLSHMVNLRRLTLPETITDAGLVHLCRLNGLEHLQLFGSVSDQGLANFKLGDKIKLKRLSIIGEKVTDEALKGIGNLSNLVYLNLDKTSVGGATLERIAHCGKLRTLIVRSRHIRDEDLAHLENLKQLKTLMFNETEIHGEGLKHLSGLKSLRVLAFNGGELDSTGVEHLKTFQHLRQVSFGRRKPPVDVVNELKAALPETLIN